MPLEMLRCVAPQSIAVPHRGYVPPVTRVVQEVSNQILVLFAKSVRPGWVKGMRITHKIPQLASSHAGRQNLQDRVPRVSYEPHWPVVFA